jgi:hypothetical protein
MLFKKTGGRQEGHADMTPSSIDDNGASDPENSSQLTAGLDAASPKAKGLESVPPDIVYPSGLKLVLLMTSIFVSMFLVSLVRLCYHPVPVAAEACNLQYITEA